MRWRRQILEPRRPRRHRRRKRQQRGRSGGEQHDDQRPHESLGPPTRGGPAAAGRCLLRVWRRPRDSRSRCARGAVAQTLCARASWLAFHLRVMSLKTAAALLGRSKYGGAGGGVLGGGSAGSSHPAFCDSQFSSQRSSQDDTHSASRHRATTTTPPISRSIYTSVSKFGDSSHTNLNPPPPPSHDARALVTVTKRVSDQELRLHDQAEVI